MKILFRNISDGKERIEKFPPETRLGYIKEVKEYFAKIDKINVRDIRAYFIK